MKRVGILGGTFDPLHNGHLQMATLALRQLPLDTVLLMPALRPPHKTKRRITDFETRVRMLESVACRTDGVEVSRMEETRGGVSYTATLLSHYRERWDDELYLIIGADSMSDLANWKTPAAITQMATIVVFPREGFSSALPIEGEAGVILLETPVQTVSSSEVRGLVRDGKSVDHLIPAPVADFILDNSLYC